MEKFNLLIVDDDFEVAKNLKSALEDYEFAVEILQNPRDVIGFLKQKKFNIIITDFFMPEMTGEELARKIRAFDKEVYIILQTAYAEEKPELEMLRSLDINGYYDKSEPTDRLIILLEQGKKICLQIEEIKKLNKQVETAHAMLSEVRNNEACIKDQTRLAILGQFLQTITVNITCTALNLQGRARFCKKYFEKYLNEQDSNKKSEIKANIDLELDILNDVAEYADNLIQNVHKKCIPPLTNGSMSDWSVKKLFEAVEISINGLIKEAGVKLLPKVDESLMLRGDFVALLQTLNVLCLKLYAHMPVPNIQIVLEARKENNNIMITATNPKVVFNDEDLSQPWKQITNQGNTQIVLGTYTAYCVITEYFKGRIWLEANKETGTTYFIEISLTEE